MQAIPEPEAGLMEARQAGLFSLRSFLAAYQCQVSNLKPDSSLQTVKARKGRTGRVASQVALAVKNPPANAGDIRDEGSIPASGRSPGEGKGNPLQSSCLENLTDRGA